VVTYELLIDFLNIWEACKSEEVFFGFASQIKGSTTQFFSTTQILSLISNCLKHGVERVVVWLQKRNPGQGVCDFINYIEDILLEEKKQ